MSKFSGFSEDDINNLKRGGPAIAERHERRPRQNMQRNLPKAMFDFPEEARLSTPPKTEPKQEMNKSPEATSTKIDTVVKTAEDIPTSSSHSLNTIGENPDLLQINKFPVDLDKFLAEQKRMEEENRRRKELLAQALADRTKKTSAEVQRLELLQQELKKLDSLLSNDVAILRNEIEDASIDFFKTQKWFSKLESEYLAAQKALTNKRQRKELLTQHLCTIIQQNELRKSEKLSSLMNELDLTLQSNDSHTPDINGSVVTQ